MGTMAVAGVGRPTGVFLILVGLTALFRPRWLWRGMEAFGAPPEEYPKPGFWIFYGVVTTVMGLFLVVADPPGTGMHGRAG
jgi:uncharacterized membrane protein YidH (DUF202 family)